MPVYIYRCQDCSSVYEERRRFEQIAEPSACPECAGVSVQRLISAPVFIRSGGERSSLPLSSAGGGCACSSGGVCACRSAN